MRGLWLQDGDVHFADDRPAPEPGADEALVRVRLAGLCQTDLELRKGYAAFTGIPGHEFVGEVADAPAKEWIGRRVVGEINVSCGRCRECTSDRRPHCAARTVIGIRGRPGALAEYLAVPLSNLHTVPDGLPDEAAVFTEPLAAALEVQEQVPVAAGQRVVVIGDGKLGQLVARTLALTGCALHVAGRHPAKLALLASRGIATLAPEVLPERLADVVVDCTGSPQGLALAARAVRPRGTIVLKSTYHGEAAVDLSGIVVDEVTIVGSRCGPFDKALELLAGRRLEVADLVGVEYPLDQGARAFDAAGRPGMLKVLVRVA